MARTSFAKINAARLAFWRLVPCLSLPATAGAETLQPAYAPPDSAVAAGSLLQMVAGLLLVLAVIGAAAWLLKRFAANPGNVTGAIRVIAGTAVGQRERVVLVEIGGTWLVIGVAPGQVRALHSMPKDPTAPFAGNSPAPPSTGFQAWLRQMMEKRDVR